MQNVLQKQNEQIFYEAGEDIRHEDLRGLLDLWNDWRAGRDMPTQQDVNPRAMMRYLARIQLYDVIDKGADFRVRLVGTGITQAFGVDLTGTFMSKHPNAARGGRIMSALNRVMEQRQPVYMKTAERHNDRYETRHVESLWLPFGENGDVQLVLAQSILKILGA